MSTHSIGMDAEEIAFAHERCKSIDKDRTVRLVSSNAEIGYDMEVLETVAGKRQLKAIEVKAWNENGHFIVSTNEIETLRALGNSGWIYLVDVKRKRVVREIQNPFATLSDLKPITFKFFY